MGRERHSRFTAFEGLSVRGQAIVMDGAESDRPQKQIQEDLLKATGEKYSNGSISRFIAEWRRVWTEEKAAEAQTQRVIRSMKANNIGGQEAAEALIKQAMFQNIDHAGSIDLETSLKLQLRVSEYEVKKQQVQQQEKKLQIAEKQLKIQTARLEAIQGKAQRIGKAVEEAEGKIRGGKNLTLRDFNHIREIYGLEKLTEAPHAA